MLAAALIDSLVQSAEQQTQQHELKYGARTVSSAVLDQARGGDDYVALLDQGGHRVLASSAGFTAQARRDLGISAALALVRSGRPYALGNVMPYGSTGVVDGAVSFPTRYGERILLTGLPPAGLNLLLGSELERIPGVQGARNYILDGSLRVIASTDPALRPGYQFTQRAVVAALKRTSVDTGSRYYDQVRLSDSTWRMVLVAPDGELFAPVSGLRKWVPWGIFAAFAFAAALALALGAAMLRFAAGRLSATERDALSERRRLEHQLAQKQRLESLGQLAGGVAHDFNNLLSVIMNYARFVGEEVTAAAAEDAERWSPVASDVAEIEGASRRAAALTRQLLAFARKEVTHPEVVGLNDVVREAQQLLERTLGEHIELRFELAEELDDVVADPGQMGQVLINLAVNARDAMPDGGTLTIETSNLDVDSSYASARPELTPGRYVRLRVSDTGVGMDADALEHAFEPFFTTKSHGAGTGLGLATIYGIVTQGGGHVSLYSEPGVGTTCTILHPATDQQGPVRDRSDAQEQRGHGEVILIVEDEDGIREVASRILTRRGYRVLAAAGGQEAVEIAREHPGRIDLLMTDVIMPRMLGTEVALRVSAERPHVRVMFMSGYAQSVLDANGSVPDGVVLLEKPFTEQNLLAKVREALALDPGEVTVTSWLAY